MAPARAPRRAAPPLPLPLLLAAALLLPLLAAPVLAASSLTPANAARRLLQNPDFQQQRGDTPSWQNPDGSVKQSQPQPAPQPEPQPQPAEQAQSAADPQPQPQAPPQAPPTTPPAAPPAQPPAQPESPPEASPAEEAAPGLSALREYVPRLGSSRLGAALAATPLGGFRSLRRNLLQNPDLPHQRGDIPSWQNPDGSVKPQTQPQAQQQVQPQAQQQQPEPHPKAQAQAQAQAQPLTLYSGGAYGSGWSDSSYKGRPFADYAPAGRQSGTAKCAYLPTGAATSFAAGYSGAFVGHRAVEFWAYRGSSLLPDVAVVLASAAGAECPASARLSSLAAEQLPSGWVRFWAPLELFGCGADVAPLAKVDLRNPNTQYDALLCVDDVRLV